MNQIFQRVEADLAVSISDLKKNPSAVVSASEVEAVAVLNHNRVVAYVISPAVWEYLQELYDDAKIVERLEKRKPEKAIPVKLDDL